MLCIGTPVFAALEAAAPLVEWAENVEVSMPAWLSCSLIQRPIVATDAGPWGLFVLMNNFLTGEVRRSAVRLRYKLIHLTGQIETFSFQASKERRSRGPEC